MSPLDTYNVVLPNDFLDTDYIWKRPKVRVSETEPSQSFGEVTVAELSSETRNLSLLYWNGNWRREVSLPLLMNHESSAPEWREIKRQIQEIYLDAGEDGWLNGEGTAVNAEGLQWLEEKLVRYLPDQSISIRLYPTEEGGVEIEYTIKGTPRNTEVSVEIDLVERSGYWHSLDLFNRSSEDKSLNLSLDKDWEWLSVEFEKARDRG